MLILYDENEINVFMRLQLKFMTQSNDQFIFVWMKSFEYDKSNSCEMLTISLNDFENSNEIVNFSIKNKKKSLYDMIKKGLTFRVFNDERMMINLEKRFNNKKKRSCLLVSKTTTINMLIDATWSLLIWKKKIIHCSECFLRNEIYRTNSMFLLTKRNLILNYVKCFMSSKINWYE